MWAVALALVYAPLSVTSALWLVAWSRRSLRSARPLLRRAGRASYAAYVLHPLVLTAVMVALAPLPVAPEAKFVVVGLDGVPSCFLVGQALLTSWVAAIPRSVSRWVARVL